MDWVDYCRRHKAKTTRNRNVPTVRRKRRNEIGYLKNKWIFLLDIGIYSMKYRDEKLKRIIDWSEKNREIRAVLLTSSLVNPLASVDEFSDLDIELVFEDNT